MQSIPVRAAVLRGGQERFGLEDVTLREPGPGEVLVRISAAGMCPADLMGRKGIPLAYPLVVGHEGAGIVEALGPGITQVKVGDHVVMSFDSCGWCSRCSEGSPAYCDHFIPLNMVGRRSDGSTPMTSPSGEPICGRWFGQSSFATHAIATERNTVVVADDLPLELLGPLGCGIQTGAGTVLNALKLGPGDSLAVFGTGAVGLAAIMAAKIAGVSEIIAVDLNAKRRDLASSLGATRVLDGADPDIVRQVRSWTGGGTDAAFDTTGVSTVVVSALNAIRPRGTCALVDVGGDLVIPPRALAGGRVLTFLTEGNAAPHQFIPLMIGLWRKGQFPFDRLIRTYPLAEINTAETHMTSGETIKPVLIPAGVAGSA
jgi:aryl-alcohol dehydrogenase